MVDPGLYAGIEFEVENTSDKKNSLGQFIKCKGVGPSGLKFEEIFEIDDISRELEPYKPTQICAWLEDKEKSTVYGFLILKTFKINFASGRASKIRTRTSVGSGIEVEEKEIGFLKYYYEMFKNTNLQKDA